MTTRAPQMSMLFDVWLVMHAMTSLIDDALAPTELSGDDFGLYSLLRRFGPCHSHPDQPVDGDAAHHGLPGAQASQRPGPWRAGAAIPPTAVPT